MIWIMLSLTVVLAFCFVQGYVFEKRMTLIETDIKNKAEKFSDLIIFKNEQIDELENKLNALDRSVDVLKIKIKAKEFDEENKKKIEAKILSKEII